MRSEFQAWYADQVKQQCGDDQEAIEPVDMSTPRMKCVGGQWLVRLYEHLLKNPLIVANGFLSAGIPQSIDAGKPILDDLKSNESSESLSETDDDDEDGEYEEDSYAEN